MSGEDLQKKLAQFEGKMGILVDQMDVARVRLCDLTIEGNLVRVGFVALETPGLNRAGPPEPIVYSTDARVLENADYWTAPYAGWRIYFDLKVIERVLAIRCQRAPPTATITRRGRQQQDHGSRPSAPLVLSRPRCMDSSAVGTAARQEPPWTSCSQWQARNMQ